MSLIDRLAAEFRRQRRRWIDGRRLSQIGGYAAYRTRISELRMRRGMVIRNRWSDVRRGSRTFRISEYRYEGRR